MIHSKSHQAKAVMDGREAVRSSTRPAVRGVRRRQQPVCPRCGGLLRRIARRTFDRLLSVFVPQRRYDCLSYTCQWTGLLRHRDV